jgi:hypothetical protein
VNFGHAVSLDGDRVAVGAPGLAVSTWQRGGVFIFSKSGPSWGLASKVIAGEDTIAFGLSVDMEGETLLVGSANKNVGGTATISGQAFIFEKNSTGWSKQAVFQPPYAPGSDRFGYAVTLRGDTAFVGSPGVPDTPWIAAGKVYVYRRAGKAWYLAQEIVPHESKLGDLFGCSLAVDQDTLVVGARGLIDPVTTSSGGAYVFARQGNSWVQTTKLIPQGRTFLCNAGWSVAVNGTIVAVGAPDDFDGGACFLYSKVAKQWVEVAKVSPYKGNADAFGFSVALDGNSLAVGAKFDKSWGSEAGAAYAYRIKVGGLLPLYYCTGKTVSGKKFGPCSPRIFTAGEPSISGAAAGEKHDVYALEVRPNVKGMLIYSMGGPAQLPFAGGTLCVQPPVVRTPLQTSSGGSAECQGYFYFDFSAWLKSGADPSLQAGTQIWLQYWYREPSFPAPNVGLTGGMTALICQ